MPVDLQPLTFIDANQMNYNPGCYEESREDPLADTNELNHFEHNYMVVKNEIMDSNASNSEEETDDSDSSDMEEYTVYLSSKQEMNPLEILEKTGNYNKIKDEVLSCPGEYPETEQEEVNEETIFDSCFRNDEVKYSSLGLIKEEPDYSPINTMLNRGTIDAQTNPPTVSLNNGRGFLPYANFNKYLTTDTIRPNISTSENRNTDHYPPEISINYVHEGLTSPSNELKYTCPTMNTTNYAVEESAISFATILNNFKEKYPIFSTDTNSYDRTVSYNHTRNDSIIPSGGAYNPSTGLSYSLKSSSNNDYSPIISNNVDTNQINNSSINNKYFNHNTNIIPSSYTSHNELINNTSANSRSNIDNLDPPKKINTVVIEFNNKIRESLNNCENVSLQMNNSRQQTPSVKHQNTVFHSNEVSINRIYNTEKVIEDCKLPKKSEDSTHLLPKKSEVHNTSQPELYFSCFICTFKTHWIEQWISHWKAIHDHFRVVPCPFCNYTNGDSNYMHIHISAVHLKQKPYSCHKCSFSTGWKRNLKKHILNKHN